ncbi:hypothetical protein CPAV1605_52 [seawater metagenome]|uniref:Type I phosphodiesterase / nucleotide pyrophosphatase n=1 Tax=seawater metagenome TaxID=1561972 RepID=A0A5E8CLP6_9ZZZZ
MAVKNYFIEIQDYQNNNKLQEVIIKISLCEITANLYGNKLNFTRPIEIDENEECTILLCKNICKKDCHQTCYQSYTIKTLKPIERKLMFICLDGVRSDAFAMSKIDFFKNLIEQEKCLYSFYLQSIKHTWSSFSWASILTGEKSSHKITSNKKLEEDNFTLDNTFTDKINKPTSLFVSEWKGFYNIFKKKEYINTKKLLNKKNFYKSDKKTINEAIRNLDKDDVEDINLVYLLSVDEVGHAEGFSPCNINYKKMIGRMSRGIENIYNKIQNRIEEKNEEWLFVIVSDHGGSSEKFMPFKMIKDLYKIRETYGDNYGKARRQKNVKGYHGLNIQTHLNTICFLSQISKFKMQTTGEILEPKSLDIYPTILNFFNIPCEGRNLLIREGM